MRIVVCVITLGRPTELARLFGALPDAAAPEDLDMVIVVDNDVLRSAEEVVERCGADLPWPVLYEVEPHRGLSTARNRAVELALAQDADLIIFIDDDEVPLRGWPRALVEAHERTGADVVTGPLFPRFRQSPPSWVAEGRFHELPVHPEGAELTYAITGNVLLTAQVVRALSPPFDPRYDLSGGEDTHLFERVRRAGYRITWSSAAAVAEVVVPERTKLAWILRREFRRGTTLSLVLRDLDRSPLRFVRRMVGGFWRIFSGAGALVRGFGRGRSDLAIGLHRMAFGAGQIAGVFGRRPLEYAPKAPRVGLRRRITGLPAARRVGAAVCGGIESVETQDPVVALTFDDGPDEVGTTAVLDVLEARGVRATFFMIAEAAERHPDLVERIRSGGHEIALHGAVHRPLPEGSVKEQWQMIRGGARRVRAVGGIAPRIFRPPYGRLDLTSRLMASALRLKVLMWSSDGFDYLPGRPEDVAQRALAGAEPGAVLLLHDNVVGRDADHHRIAVGLIIDGLGERGLEIVSVAALLDSGPARRTLALERRAR